MALVESAGQGAPWAATDAYVGAVREGRGSLALTGAGDPSGRGRGYSFTRDILRVGMLLAALSALRPETRTEPWMLQVPLRPISSHDLSARLPLGAWRRPGVAAFRPLCTVLEAPAPSPQFATASGCPPFLQRCDVWLPLQRRRAHTHPLCTRQKGGPTLQSSPPNPGCCQSSHGPTLQHAVEQQGPENGHHGHGGGQEHASALLDREPSSHLNHTQWVLLLKNTTHPAACGGAAGPEKRGARHHGHGGGPAAAVHGGL